MDRIPNVWLAIKLNLDSISLKYVHVKQIILIHLTSQTIRFVKPATIVAIIVQHQELYLAHFAISLQILTEPKIYPLIINVYVIMDGLIMV